MYIEKITRGPCKAPAGCPAVGLCMDDNVDKYNIFNVIRNRLSCMYVVIAILGMEQ